LAVANYHSDTVSVLLGNGDGTLDKENEYGTGWQPSCVAVGDLNRDGKLDLAVVNEGSGTVSVLLNTRSRRSDEKPPR
jgi:hypothetical protein